MRISLPCKTLLRDNHWNQFRHVSQREQGGDREIKDGWPHQIAYEVRWNANPNYFPCALSLQVVFCPDSGLSSCPKRVFSSNGGHVDVVFHRMLDRVIWRRRTKCSGLACLLGSNAYFWGFSNKKMRVRANDKAYIQPLQNSWIEGQGTFFNQ